MLPLLLIVALQVSGSDIVVNSKPLEDAVAECDRGGCPPLRDARVSIAWAEQQFREGAYLKAKHILADAVARNRSFATSDPKPVAALYEAYATVALQDGDTDVYRRAVSGQVRTLRDNLPPTDPAVADAALALGDMWVKLGQPESADAAYRAAERQATRQGQKTVALSGALRRVWLASARGDVERAARMLDSLASGPAAQDPAIQAILPVIRLRLAVKHADDAQIDQLVKTISGSADVQPTLLWAPPYSETAAAAARNAARKFDLADPVTTTSAEAGTIKWADIGFWIRPNGRTEDAEVLRGSRSRAWTAPVIAQIEGRRYTAREESGASQGVYRIERFTERGTYRVPIGSLVRRRGGPESLEVLDLTGDMSDGTARP